MDKETDQLAAEAAKQIIAMPMINEYLIDDVADIIKSVIEKAKLVGWKEGREHLRESLKHPVSRAAHASEHKAGCPALGGYGHGEEECICRAAHASEQETPEYQQFLAECAKHCRCSMTICESVLAGAPCEERIEPNDLDDNLP